MLLGPLISSGRLPAGSCKLPLWLQMQGSHGVSAKLAKETAIVQVMQEVRNPFSTAIDHAGYTMVRTLDADLSQLDTPRPEMYANLM